MTDDTKKKATPRRRGKPIEVWVTDEEKGAITERAEEAGMSRSGYLRALGLNSPIRSVVDLKAVADLAKVNGDLGRVAGLLKLWLAEKRGQGASPIEVERMMIELRELQSCIRGKMSAIVYVKNGDGTMR
ncbi:plasmid mobilization protein [Pseudomonas asplenii]|uniref:plasmid mobilization protein n=1 Tax=Pseudomonas asplenii TaxID=53407 RepID=UPI002361BFE7|nr:CopG family transcriptional regulator [Pseudomonas asplenii]